MLENKVAGRIIDKFRALRFFICLCVPIFLFCLYAICIRFGVNRDLKIWLAVFIFLNGLFWWILVLFKKWPPKVISLGK